MKAWPPRVPSVRISPPESTKTPEQNHPPSRRRPSNATRPRLRRFSRFNVYACSHVSVSRGERAPPGECRASSCFHSPPSRALSRSSVTTNTIATYISATACRAYRKRGSGLFPSQRELLLLLLLFCVEAFRINTTLGAREFGARHSCRSPPTLLNNWRAMTQL